MYNANYAYIIGIVHNANCAALVLANSDVVSAYLALCTMPNMHKMNLIKIECTAKNIQNRDFLLVESSNLRPLIGREDHQKNSKGLTLIQECKFGFVNNAKYGSPILYVAL